MVISKEFYDQTELTVIITLVEFYGSLSWKFILVRRKKN